MSSANNRLPPEPSRLEAAPAIRTATCCRADRIRNTATTLRYPPRPSTVTVALRNGKETPRLD
jgi:hypothetical protein